MVIPTKTYTSLVSTYLYPCITKLRRKSHNLSQKSLFWTSKEPFAIRSFVTSYNVCPVAIPELFAQTQGSDYWQLIHCRMRSKLINNSISLWLKHFWFNFERGKCLWYILEKKPTLGENLKTIPLQLLSGKIRLRFSLAIKYFRSFFFKSPSVLLA